MFKKINLNNQTTQSGLKKIKNIIPCSDPAHNPPMHMYLEAGVYEYTCPSCGYKTKFTVPIMF